MLRQGLRTGPVLIQVAAAGYWPTVVCRRCDHLARCPHCSGPLSMDAGGRLTCGWCDREPTSWRCPQCSGRELRGARVGSSRTAEEIARNLPDASVLESSAAHRITRMLPARPTVVVATAGAEPPVEGGYACAIILDAAALAGRAELWAPEEAARRWLDALSLVRPAHPGLAKHVCAIGCVRAGGDAQERVAQEGAQLPAAAQGGGVQAGTRAGGLDRGQPQGVHD